MDPVSRAQNSDQNSPRVIGRPFPKGVSGNPGGRPKKTPLTEIYSEIFDDPKVREKVKQQIIHTMTSKGMAGVLERREAAERTEGKVAQRVEMSGELNVNLESVLEARKRAGK